jgi:hypothetical protein
MVAKISHPDLGGMPDMMAGPLAASEDVQNVLRAGNAYRGGGGGGGAHLHINGKVCAWLAGAAVLGLGIGALVDFIGSHKGPQINLNGAQEGASLVGKSPDQIAAAYIHAAGGSGDTLNYDPNGKLQGLESVGYGAGNGQVTRDELSTYLCDQGNVTDIWTKATKGQADQIANAINELDTGG